MYVRGPSSNMTKRWRISSYIIGNFSYTVLCTVFMNSILDLFFKISSLWYVFLSFVFSSLSSPTLFISFFISFPLYFFLLPLNFPFFATFFSICALCTFSRVSFTFFSNFFSSLNWSLLSGECMWLSAGRKYAKPAPQPRLLTNPPSSPGFSSVFSNHDWLRGPRMHDQTAVLKQTFFVHIFF